MPKLLWATPRTQKAKGIKWLLTTKYPNNTFGGLNIATPEKVYLIQETAEITLATVIFPCFGRPCPINPAHGFVESRIVNNVDEVATLWQETIVADPMGELLLMPIIKAACSAIYVGENGVLTIGPSNNGATAGNKEAITLPVAPTPYIMDFGSIGINNGNVAYFELVYGTVPNSLDYDVCSYNYAYLVQARAGVACNPVDKEFFPPGLTQVEVKEILEPNGDDLWWMKVTKDNTGKLGVIAYQENAPLTSHHAHHCKTNNIPFVTRTPKPNIGDIITYTPTPDAKFDEREFRIGVALGERKNRVGKELPFAIAVIHNAMYLSKSPYYARLLGYASTIIYRAGATACLGEARHYSGKNKWSRESVYRHAETSELVYLNTQLVNKTPRFIHANHWSSAFGRWPWFESAVASIKLWNRISECNPLQVLEATTTLLNKAHNNGWLFNKFIHQSVMDVAANSSGWAIVSHINDLYEVIKAVDVTPHKFRRRTRRVAGKKAIDWALIAGNKDNPTVEFTVCGQRILTFNWKERVQDLDEFFTEV